MDERLRIMTKYKKQFRQYFEETMATSCMVWGLEVPDEWLPIIEEACERIERDGTHVEWDQIKEKFNMLRMYYRVASGSEFDEDFVCVVVTEAEEAVRKLYKRGW